MMVVAAKNGTSKKSQAGKKPYPPKPDPKDAATTVDAKRNENIGNIGSKIHAQRKFAQGAAITPGTFSTVKLSKEARKKRKEKRPTSPVFLPLKRPKTEDFLAFLCFRGTGVLSPDLDYFNYTPSSENVTEDSSKVSTPENEKKSGGLAKFTNSLPVKEDEPRASTSSTTLTKKEKTASSTKSANASNCDSASSTSKTPALKKIPDVMVVVKQAEKAIAAFGKVRKDSSPTITKPPRLNEQDAKFAMTALKLKYQEKRLAKSKPAITVASKITKKGKTVILTRSKSKNSCREISKSPPLKKVIPTKLKKDARSQSRNAPSPDIIFGVSHGKQTKKPELSSEESESDGSGREASSVSNNDEENSNSSSSDDSDAVPVKRALRNGKELMTLPEKLSSAKPTPKRKSSTPIRVSTRASHRQSTSPLRELPMYNIKKKKNKPAKGRKSSNKKTEPTKETKQELAGSSRPTRKTKETASIYLGLINRFTSDEDDSSEKQEDGNESTGSSSSSEAKFLEKHYNASIKRDEQSNTSKKSASSKISTLNTSKISSKKSSQQKNKPKKSVTGSSNSKDAPKKGPAKRILRSQSRDKTPSPPLRRIGTRRLSMPTISVDNRTEGAARKSATVYPRRRDSYFSSSSGSLTSSEHESSSSSENENEAEKPSSSSKNLSIETGKTTLAARKSATIIPRKSSVSHTGSSTKNANKNSAKATKKIQKGALVKSKAAKIGTNSSEDEDEDTENDSDDSKKEDTKKIIIEIQRESPSQVSGSQDSSSDDESSENDAQDEPVSSTEEETKPVIETTSIAIQVDLDSEEASNNSDSQSRATSTDPPDPPLVPTPPVTSAVPITVTASGITNYMSTVNISNSQIPYHFSSPNPAFYPTLHLAPPVVNNIQLLTRGTQEFSLNSPAISMNIPVSVPFNGIGAPMLQPNTMCFSSTSISAAATLQTHIRSVAANLDIPLVRPIVGAEHPLNIPFPRLSMSHMMRSPNRIPLTRPVAVWSNDSKPHSSAFRVPNTGVRIVKPGSSNSSNTFLPLSVMQQQHIHNQHMQYVQSQSSSRFSMMSTDSTSHMGQQGVGISASNVSNANTVRTGTPGTTPGYSILHSLPNVSIVPRFDRNSKPVVHPNDQEALERKIKKSNIEAKNKANAAAKAKEEAKEAKEKGGKKKKILLLPQQTSPLTVRKDSTAPATYAGVTAKKGQKATAEKEEGSKEDRKKHTAPDPFNKLLQLKKPDTSSSGDLVASTAVDKHHDRPLHSSKPKESGKVDKPQKEHNEERNKNDAEEGDGACTSSDISEVPTFFPTEDQFQDPVKYIEEIRSKAEAFGMAKIVPPRSFRPDCNVDDDMRFTAYNHYIHKMYQRWGPNVHETQAIKEHLRKSDIDISTVPMIGGMEIDLCTLYHTVQSFGGLKETIEKQKWNKVSDAMHIPKAANDRASKLDSVYMKYVLPYEMLSDGERKRLLNKVEKNWNARQQRLRKKIEAADSSDESDYEDPLEEVDDCIIKGKSTPLSAYFRVARNTRTMIFQNKEPSTDEVEEEYWSTVRKRTKHLCVYSGSIDCTGTTGVGWGFPLPKASNNKHPWNLKVLATNPGSILRSMGPVMGATVPTLHVGMIFTTYCWYRDPHGLPWVEYLHSGGEKIWYVIPAAEENKFRNVVKQLMPLQCRNKKIWLASDSAMIPPELLVQHGVSLSRVIQNPGEFVVVFPKSYTSAICTSYVVSESVCFAPNEWLLSAPEIFSDIKASKEPPVFPIEKLLLSILQDHKISFEILKIVLPQSEVMLKDEFTLRKKLVHLGVQSGKLGVKPSSDKKSSKKRKQEDEVQQCDTCNYILFLSLVTNETHGFSYCLPHALEHLQIHKSHVKTSVLRYDRSQEDLIAILKEITNRLSPS